MFVALPGLAGLGTPELLIIVLILVLLFGAKKLPDLARGSGRAIRIFKSETKGLMDDDDEDEQEAAPQQLTQNVAPPQPTEPSQAAPPAQPRPPMHTEN